MFNEDEFIFEERDLPLLLIFDAFTKAQLRRLGITTDRHLGAVSGAICCAAIAGHVDKWVSYSRNPNHYSFERPYLGQEYTQRRVFYAVDLLLALGLIAEQRQKPHHYGWQSRFCATDRLLKLTRNWSFPNIQPTEVLRLRDKKKKPLKLPELEEVDGMRAQIERHNELLVQIKVSIADDTIDLNVRSLMLDGRIIIPDFLRMHRVFNGSLLYGGRLYGGFWQNLPKEFRAKLLIDGCPVVELDYPSFHPHLLYAAFGKMLPCDAYTLDGLDRNIGKVAFQMLLNCRSPRQAELALSNQLIADGYSSDRANADKLARRVLKKLNALHRPVQSAFYQIVGRRLQRIDSDLMLRVMDRCSHLGICGLPVHDSLIVPEAHEAVVQSIMMEELQVTCNLLSSDGFQGLLNPQ